MEPEKEDSQQVPGASQSNLARTLGPGLYSHCFWKPDRGYELPGFIAVEYTGSVGSSSPRSDSCRVTGTGSGRESSNGTQRGLRSANDTS